MDGCPCLASRNLRSYRLCMAVQSTARTDHHYIPQFLLRGFASAKRKQVYVFDKSNDNEFRSSVRNLACQRDFYDPDLDKWLGKLEDTSELQSPCNLVCRLLLEKKKKKKTN